MDQDIQFKRFINQGILITNKEEAGKENPLYERKRRTEKTESLVMCSECCIFISPTSMSNHTKLCSEKKTPLMSSYLQNHQKKHQESSNAMS